MTLISAAGIANAIYSRKLACSADCAHAKAGCAYERNIRRESYVITQQKLISRIKYAHLDRTGLGLVGSVYVDVVVLSRNYARKSKLVQGRWLCT